MQLLLLAWHPSILLMLIQVNIITLLAIIITRDEFIHRGKYMRIRLVFNMAKVNSI